MAPTLFRTPKARLARAESVAQHSPGLPRVRRTLGPVFSADPPFFSLLLAGFAGQKKGEEGEEIMVGPSPRVRPTGRPWAMLCHAFSVRNHGNCPSTATATAAKLTNTTKTHTPGPTLSRQSTIQTVEAAHHHLRHPRSIVWFLSHRLANTLRHCQRRPTKR